MNPFGLAVGLATLVVLGLGFVWVIRAERYLGYLWWPYFLGAGLLLVIASMLIPNDWGAALVGVLGASLVWGSTELKDQAVRAELGWFPFRKEKRRPPFAQVIEKWKPPHL
ncbi:MAG: DUF4491 family protein [Chloroflexota bacterium]